MPTVYPGSIAVKARSHAAEIDCMEARAPARTAWLPPIEARPDGTPLPERRRFLTPLALAGIALLVMLVAGIVVLRGPAAATTPATVARKFVDARAGGDAATACRQLTLRARRELVAELTGVNPATASARDCERYVLSSSESSEFTNPALPEFRGRKMVVSYYPSREAAMVHAQGLGDDPVLEARAVGGTWKLDYSGTSQPK
jgi:hypothetical protein